ncbi:MAG TPA: hypothetical protein VGL08_14820 [Paraburkholderia sp.]|jgi:hypothetical protein
MDLLAYEEPDANQFGLRDRFHLFSEKLTIGMPNPFQRRKVYKGTHAQNPRTIPKREMMPLFDKNSRNLLILLNERKE